MTRLHLQLAAAATTGARLSGWWHGALPVGEQTAVMHVQCRALATLRTKRTGGGMAAILWESAVTLTRTDDHFPFAIDLPAEAPGTAGLPWRVEWEVRLALAEVGTTIVIPVTGRAPQGLEVPLALPADPHEAKAADLLASAAGITVERTPGRVTYDCSGYRPASLYLIFTALVAGLIAGFALLPNGLAMAGGEPLDDLFLLLWRGGAGGIGGLLLFLNLRHVFLRVRARVDGDGIEIRSGWLFAWRHRFIPAAEIHGFVRARGLNDGMVAFWDRRRFHHIYVDHGQRPMIGDLRARGRLTLCAWMLPDLRLGQAVQADLERLLGSTHRMPAVRAEAGRQAADGGRFAP